MKALKLIIIGIVLFFASPVQAQISVSLHFGTPPQWGPVGYSQVRYYYLPDVEAYYDIRSSMFIYYSGGVWIHRTYLPSRYRNYDLYNGYKVVMTDYRGNTPYTHFREYKTRYARGYHGREQRSIGERPGRDNSRERTYSNGPSYNRVTPSNDRNVGRGNVQTSRPSNDQNVGRGNVQTSRPGNVQNSRPGNDKNAGRGNEKNANKEQGRNGGNDKKNK